MARGGCQYKRYGKTHYERNREYYAAKKNAHRKVIQDFLRDLKERTSCTDCGIRYAYYVMDFDHRDPKQKVLTLARAYLRGWSLKKLQTEIDKCDIVCANCHRIRTHSGC